VCWACGGRAVRGSAHAANPAADTINLISRFGCELALFHSSQMP